ncbi:hypothetical protein AAG589_20910 [Isoptericola sp. F-RaC21]|uniref:hypothetical protein n=1 Tax=Isoptericola sp. F-RaC21 TaxID=3141452 RepID=UPI00315B84D9
MTGQTPTQNPTDAALLDALDAAVNTGAFRVFDPQTTTPDDLDAPARDSDDAEKALTQALAHVRAARRILHRSGMRDDDVLAASDSLRTATNRLWAAHPSLNPTR